MKASTETTPGWLAGLGIALLGAAVFIVSILITFIKGVGTWGINIPVAWAFAIANFIWWIGIGHAGTFISAILFLARQEWRTSISRLAETMTIFAVVCAGLFPILHLGRPWFFYWLFPYWDAMDLWPQWRSPLVWDVFAVSTYLTVSFLYWFLGLIPDLAIYRDEAKSAWKKRFYGTLALGWRGSVEQWREYKMTYLLLAGLATPLVISVHSIVGLDFAVALVPGWHSTIFPPYFVAGAIFSGFAMVLTLAIVCRRALHLESVITLRHLELCAKFMLAMGIIVAYGYAIEFFTAFYSGDPFEIARQKFRYTGDYAVISWIMLFCNVVVPQLVWMRKIRTNPALLFIISILVNIGMWAERFVIVATSLHKDFLPSTWHMYYPSAVDWGLLGGSLFFFASCYLLFTRVFPIVAIAEVRGLNAREGAIT